MRIEKIYTMVGTSVDSELHVYFQLHALLSQLRDKLRGIG